MATRKEIEQRACAFGSQAGADAASWYFDNNASREQALKVLKGITDGDPEIVDTLPHSPLSGEMADGMTPMRLWEALDMNQLQVNAYGDDICTEYEIAFSASALDIIEMAARELAELEVNFHISVNVVEQDPKKIMSDLEEVIGKHNLDLNFASIDIHGT